MPMLRGMLPGIALVDVLRMLHGNRNTGELILTREGHSGVFYLQLGEVTHAETGPARGEAAAYDLLGWDEGEFEFVITTVQKPTTITRPVQDLVAEAARTRDTRSHLSGYFPDPALVPWPTLAKAKLAQGLEIPAAHLAVLDFMDGYRAFPEVIAASGLSELSVLQLCAALQAAGRMVLLDPSLSVTASGPKAGFLQMGYQAKLSMAQEEQWQGRKGSWDKLHQPCLLAKGHENRWKAMGPYGAKPIERVRLDLPGGPMVAPVQFIRGMDEHTVEMAKELMQSWALPDGTSLKVRPAPDL